VRAAVQQIDPAVPVDLKWPNDLLIEGRKFCGILSEMNAEATRVRHLVIGIGINVNQIKFPAALQEIATSLRMATGETWSRLALPSALLKSLNREYNDFLRQPDAPDSIRRRFEAASSSVRGRRVKIEDHGGFEGVTDGLDARGFLRVRAGDEVRVVLSGTVR